MRKNTIIVLLVLLLVGAVLYSYGMAVESDNRREVFIPIGVITADEIRCTVDASGGVYDGNSRLEPKEAVEIHDLHKDKNPIKFTFKIDNEKAKILVSDSGGVSEVEGHVIVNNEDKIHLINSWGLNQDNIQVFTIYPKTGFFNWARFGDMLFIGNSMAFGYGRCL